MFVAIDFFFARTFRVILISILILSLLLRFCSVWWTWKYLWDDSCVLLHRSATDLPDLPSLLYHMALFLKQHFQSLLLGNSLTKTPVTAPRFLLLLSSAVLLFILSSISPRLSSVYAFLTSSWVHSSFLKLGVANRRCPSFCPFHLFQVLKSPSDFPPHF